MMEFVIEHSHTKRAIKGPFNICGTKDDLQWLADQLHEKIARGGDFSYGWIQIIEPAIAQGHLANTPPLGWDET